MSDIKLYYFKHPKPFPDKFNFGDKLSQLLVEKVTDLKVEHSSPKNAHLFAVGSIMASVPRAEKAAVWGTGIMFEEHSWKNLKNVDILALRGKLTAERMGVDTDIPLGDPALLVSRYYKKAWRKKYKLGVIPHYVDKDHELAEFAKNRKDVLLIDVFDTPENVCRQVSSCRAVVSSSLHGIIVAHSYGVQAAWVELSDKVAGSGFKFRDYYSVFDRQPDKIGVTDVMDLNLKKSTWAPTQKVITQLSDNLIKALQDHFKAG